MVQYEQQGAAGKLPALEPSPGHSTGATAEPSRTELHPLPLHHPLLANITKTAVNGCWYCNDMHKVVTLKYYVLLESVYK